MTITDDEDRVPLAAALSLRARVAIVGDNGPDTLDGGSEGDMLEGAGGNDILRGHDGDDRLFGGVDADTLDGGAGADLLDGGSGFDTMSGGAGDDTYLVGDNGDRVIERDGEGIDTIRTTLSFLSLDTFLVQTPYIEFLSYVGSADFTGTGGQGTRQITGGAGHDTLRAAETLVGGDGNDTLSLGRRMEGGAGDDTIYGVPETRSIGGAGADRFIGGVADYSMLSQPLVIDASEIGHGGDAEGDRYSGTMDVIGSVFGDTMVRVTGSGALYGGDGDDDLTGTSKAMLDGGNGDDILRSTGSGNSLFGGSGIDTASYAAAPSGRTISLRPVDNPPGVTFGRDYIGGVENVVGTAFADTLTGSGDDNRLDGGAGDDLVVVSGSVADDTIVARDDGYLLADHRAADGDGADTLVGVERLRFLDGAVFAIEALVNVAPVAHDDAAGVSEAGSGEDGVAHATGNVLANDEDANFATAGFGESLAIAETIVLDGAYGTLTLTPDGNYRYVLDDARRATDDLRAGQRAQDRFAYTVLDARGLTASATLVVTVSGAADTIASRDLVHVTRGAPAMVATSALLANDAAGDGATIGAIANATGAAVKLQGGTIEIHVKRAGGGFDYTVVAANGETAIGHVDLVALNAGRIARLSADPLAAAVDFVGGDGKDVLIGGIGDDRLVGLAGDDRLAGAAGADRLDGGGGADRMTGGDGDDRYTVDHARDTVIERAGEGTDTVVASIDHRLGNHVENLVLVGAALKASGNSLENGITGNDAANLLAGGGGGDTLIGGGGDDTLTGDAGRDVLTGGDGADRFAFGPGDSGASLPSADRITDFDAAQGDRIVLAAIDAIAGTPDNDRFVFIGSAAFGGAAGQLRHAFVGGSTLIEGDVDGDGIADLAIQLTGTVALTAADFAL